VSFTGTIPGSTCIQGLNAAYLGFNPAGLANATCSSNTAPMQLSFSVPKSPPDQVTLTNRLVDNGFVVSGLASNGPWLWKSFLASSDTTRLGDDITMNLNGPNEVIAFGRYQAPARVTPSSNNSGIWKQGTDEVTVALGNEISVDVQPMDIIWPLCEFI
jgi:hypothetical protein